MNRLQKFVERGSFGEGPGRTAYSIDPTKLPDAIVCYTDTTIAMPLLTL
jgi:hypothetical protein